MALRGTVRFYNIVDDEDNPRVEEVCYPEQMAPEDPNYEKRGTCVEETMYDRKEVLEREEEDVYVLIKMCALHLEDFDYSQDETFEKSYKHWNVMYRVQLYLTPDDRVLNVHNYFMNIDSDFIHIEDLGQDHAINTTNLLAYCYDHLKKQRGFEDCIDV